MIKLNGSGTRAIVSINSFANMCGHFYNAAYNSFDVPTPNNGYNCNHPECQQIVDGYGCCYTWACPLGWEADEEDCSEFGVEYEESEFIITENSEILKRLVNEI